MIFSLINIIFSVSWSNRRVYQLLTDRFQNVNENNASCDNLRLYCGGSYDGITSKLDYIQNLGFNAIWISPILEQTNDVYSYHGYWQKSLSNLNLQFGSEESLQRLISECHGRNILVMVDVIYNHMGDCFEKGKWDCNNEFLEAEHYHPFCDILDFENFTQVTDCWFANLPDLDQRHPFVKQRLLIFTQEIMNKYNFDAMRIDTVKHIDHDFWRELRPHTPWFVVGEVWVENREKDYEMLLDFMRKDEVESLFDYPLFHHMNAVFGLNASMFAFQTHFTKMQQQLGARANVMGIISENHDNPRFRSKFGNLNRNIDNLIAMTLTWSGIPYFYYGQEQNYDGGGDHECREPLWWSGFSESGETFRFVQKINQILALQDLETAQQTELFAAENMYAFMRGEMLVFLTNAQKTVGFPRVSQLQEKYCNIFNTQDQLSLNSKVVLQDGEPKIYFPCARLGVEAVDSRLRSYALVTACSLAAGAAVFLFARARK